MRVYFVKLCMLSPLFQTFRFITRMVGLGSIHQPNELPLLLDSITNDLVESGTKRFVTTAARTWPIVAWESRDDSSNDRPNNKQWRKRRLLHLFQFSPNNKKGKMKTCPMSQTQKRDSVPRKINPIVEPGVTRSHRLCRSLVKSNHTNSFWGEPLHNMLLRQAHRQIRLLVHW